MTLAVQNLCKRYGGLLAVEGLSFSAEPGKITAVIGPNGAGKTTALNLISGVVPADSGTMQLFGADATGLSAFKLVPLGLTRTYQSPQLFEDMTVLETVMTGAHLSGRSTFLSALIRARGLGSEERRLETMARESLRRVGIADELLDRNAVELAYGYQRRVEIARALATRPKMMMLDEPAAGLNANETRDIAVLVKELATEGLGIVLVEHDMDMVMSISDHVVVMSFGKKIAEGTPAQVQADPTVIDAYLGMPEADDAFAN